MRAAFVGIVTALNGDAKCQRSVVVLYWDIICGIADMLQKIVVHPCVNVSTAVVEICDRMTAGEVAETGSDLELFPNSE